MNFLLKKEFVKVVHYLQSYCFGSVFSSLSKKKKKKKKIPILFNLFVNDILNNCEKYGVSIGRKKCCGGLFADDVVFIAPSAKNLEKLLKKVH